MRAMCKKILIIRFSSFGDIVQCLNVVDNLKEEYPDSSINWVVRADMASVLNLSSEIDKVWKLDRSLGFKGLKELARGLKKENYDLIYDAHYNLRSLYLKFILLGPIAFFFSRFQKQLALRRKSRIKRFLLFKMRLNYFPKPFKGAESYLNPLAPWNISQNIKVSNTEELSRAGKNLISLHSTNQNIDSFITLVPSAAWDMKKWPVSNWKELIKRNHDKKFIILGGPDDEFCESLKEIAPERVFNFAGKLSLHESCLIVAASEFLISADTGLLHVADYLGIKGLALIGPSAFGYPSNKNLKVLEANLSCSPCSKDGSGSCSRSLYQECMTSITVDEVSKNLENR
jgi:ADP-heptose:LPS heptosyltransferase